MKYEFARLDDKTDNREEKIRALRSHGVLVEGKGIVVDGIQIVEEACDSYLLCMSTLRGDVRMKRMFGEHCIQIADPSLFFEIISRAVDKIVPSDGQFAAVQYSGRNFKDSEARSGVPEFSSVESLSMESEVRIVMRPVESKAVAAPFFLDVPEAGKLCSMVP